MTGWHPHFAWWPVRVGNRYAWLRTVQRLGFTGRDGAWYWRYVDVR